MTGRIIELPPKPAAEIRTPPGYRLSWEECFGCRRDFAVSIPVRDQLTAVLTVDVSCPHCHRYRAEVLVDWSSQPLYVEAIQRSWTEWRIRSVRRRVTTAWRTLRIGVGQLLRQTKRLFRPDPPAPDA
jgi:hypothetical protein